jgi:hypothetical protein
MASTSTSTGMITAWSTSAAETGENSFDIYIYTNLFLDQLKCTHDLDAHAFVIPVRFNTSQVEAVQKHGEEYSIQTETNSSSFTMGKGSCPSS